MKTQQWNGGQNSRRGHLSLGRASERARATMTTIHQWQQQQWRQRRRQKQHHQQQFIQRQSHHHLLFGLPFTFYLLPFTC